MCDFLYVSMNFQGKPDILSSGLKNSNPTMIKAIGISEMSILICQTARAIRHSGQF